MKFSGFLTWSGSTGKQLTRLALLLLVMVTLLMPFGSAALAASSSKDDPHYVGDKSVQTNPDGTKAHPDSGPLSAESQKILDLKQQLSDKYASVRAGKYDRVKYNQEWTSFLDQIKEDRVRHAMLAAPQTATGVKPDALYTANTLSVLQVSQINSYYCGPATAYEILKYLGNNTSYYGASLSQSALGSTCTVAGCRSTDGNYLQTDAHVGTDWYDGGGHPMPDGLNYWRQGSVSGFYEPVGTTVNATTFKNNFTSDIDSGYPVAGNADEVANAPQPYHLIGHPANANILHWFAIRGYADSGNTVAYVDSVSGASSISYSSTTPAYNSMATSTIAVILDGRGYVW